MEANTNRTLPYPPRGEKEVARVVVTLASAIEALEPLRRGLDSAAARAEADWEWFARERGQFPRSMYSLRQSAEDLRLARASSEAEGEARVRFTLARETLLPEWAIEVAERVWDDPLGVYQPGLRARIRRALLEM